MQQINPHAPKQECDRLVQSNQIIGCGKPFLVIDSPNEPTKKVAIECDYI